MSETPEDERAHKHSLTDSGVHTHSIPAGSHVHSINPYDFITSDAVESLRKAQKDKKTYTEKLETATGDDIFKYLLLIDTSALEGYIAQTRLQAQESFKLSKRVAIIGFCLIVGGIILGIISNFIANSILDVAYLASIAGILTEFISGVFFYLYNRTLQQLNRFHDKMMASKQSSVAFLASNSIVDVGKRDETKAELSKLLLSE